MTAPALLDLNRYSVGIGALNGNGTIDDVAGGGTSVLTVGNGGAIGTFSGTIQNTSGTVSLVVAGSGTETLTGANTFSGPTTISSGTLNLANAAALSSSSAVTVNAGSLLNFSPSLSAATLGSLAGAGNVRLNNTLLSAGANNSSTAFSGTMSSLPGSPSSGFVKVGNGTMTLSGNNTYAGPTTVKSGTLLLSGGAVAGTDIGIKFDNLAATSLTGTAGVVPMGNWNLTTAGNATLANLNYNTGGTSGVTAVWGSPPNNYTYNTGDPTTQNGYLLQSYLNQTTTTAETVAFTNIPSSYQATGYTVYAYYNSNNGNNVVLNVTGGSAIYGVCTGNVATFVQSNGTSATDYVAGDYVDWTGLSTAAFTATLTQTGGGAGICGIEIVQNVASSSGLNLLPVSTALTVTPGATFDLGGGTQTVASLSDYAVGSSGTIQSSGGFGLLTVAPTGGSTIFSGLIGGTGSLGNLAFVLSGSSLLNLAGANNYTGGTTINGGTLQMGNTLALGASTGPLTLNGGLLDLNGNSLAVGTLNGSGGTIDNVSAGGLLALTVGNGGGTGTFAGTIRNTSGTLALVKTGSGTQFLSGVNMYSGGTFLNGGILNFASSAALGSNPPSITFNGGSLQYAANNTFDASAYIAPIAAGQSAIIDTGTNSVTFATGLSGSGGLTKAGSGLLTLSAVNSFTGLTIVSGGTLAIADPAGNALAQSGGVTVNAGNTLALNATAGSLGSLAGAGSVYLNNGRLTAGGNGASTNFSGVISGAGGFTKVGSGTMSLSGGNTYGGSTLISAGIVRLAGTAAGSPVTAGLLYDLDASNAASVTTTGGYVTSISSLGNSFSNAASSVTLVNGGAAFNGLNVLSFSGTTGAQLILNNSTSPKTVFFIESTPTTAPPNGEWAYLWGDTGNDTDVRFKNEVLQSGTASNVNDFAYSASGGQTYVNGTLVTGAGIAATGAPNSWRLSRARAAWTRSPGPPRRWATASTRDSTKARSARSWPSARRSPPGKLRPWTTTSTTSGWGSARRPAAPAATSCRSPRRYPWPAAARSIWAAWVSRPWHRFPTPRRAIPARSRTPARRPRSSPCPPRSAAPPSAA